MNSSGEKRNCVSTFSWEAQIQIISHGVMVTIIVDFKKAIQTLLQIFLLLPRKMMLIFMK